MSHRRDRSCYDPDYPGLQLQRECSPLGEAEFLRLRQEAVDSEPEEAAGFGGLNLTVDEIIKLVQLAIVILGFSSTPSKVDAAVRRGLLSSGIT